MNDRAGCFPNIDPDTLPRCATCGGIYPIECPPHRTDPGMSDVTPSAENDAPTEGWLPFGALIEHPDPVEFSTESDEAGMPLWERVTNDDQLAGVLADEIRMYADAHGSWLPIDLARNLTKQLRAAGWSVIPPEVTP